MLCYPQGITARPQVDLQLELIVAHANEDRKSLATFTFLLDELKRTDPLRRSEPVLAVGGGVLTDTAGFACACWRRGIPWARLPTTLLGIVDASVGIKVAINYHRKNGVGHFYSPLHTFIDTSFLDTVSRPDIRSGCGEIMKVPLARWPPLPTRRCTSLPRAESCRRPSSTTRASTSYSTPTARR